MHDGNGGMVDQVDVQDEFDMVNSIILTSSLLVLVMVGYFINTHRIKNLPESGAAMGLGFFVGVATRVLGMRAEQELLDPNGRFGAILAFAVLGTVISAWMVSMGMYMAAHAGIFGLVPSDRLALICHLFGALISATDPVATIALFGSSRYRTDPLLTSLMNGESVLNDAVALVLFITLSHHLDAEEAPALVSTTVLGRFVFVLLGSIVAGLGAGALCSWRFCKSHALSRFPEYEISAILLGAYLTYTFTQLIGLSGIVALFFFGVVLSHYNWYNLSDTSKVASKVTFGTLAKLSEACVFIYLGVVAALSLGRFHWNIGLVMFAMVLITIARAAHIFPLAAVLNNCGRDRKITQNMKIMMWASGLRGAIAFAMSLRIPCRRTPGLTLPLRGSPECRNSDLLVTTTISIVMMTTMVIGGSMEKVATMLGVIELNDQTELSEPLATDGPSASGARSSAAGADVPLASMGRLNSEAEGGPLPSVSLPTYGAPRFSEDGDSSESSERSPSLYGMAHGMARSLNGQRFAARGQLYQAFARFDCNVLQPNLGGPGRMRMGGREPAEFVMQDLSYADQPGFTRLLDPPMEEETPTWSRSVIFE